MIYIYMVFEAISWFQYCGVFMRSGIKTCFLQRFVRCS